MSKTIIFTGGGSGGHVVPAITLIEQIRKDDSYNIQYVGSHNGIEKELIAAVSIPYHSVSTGKLRRYISRENVMDIFKVLFGIIQAFFLLLRLSDRKSIVFSTGGFVSIPVVIAAKCLGRTIYIHEQTSRVGLANKIASFFASKIFISFSNSADFFPKHKTLLSGYPLREECFSKETGKLTMEGISLNDVDRPIMFVTGGGNGSMLINNLILKHLDILKKKYFIVHQVGSRFADELQQYRDDNYLPVAFVTKGMIDLFKMASVVVSRAGAGTVCELMGIGKKSLYIPLKGAQKNEQYHNAMEANKLLGSVVLEEKDIEGSDLLALIAELDNSESHSSRDISTSDNAVEFIINHIKKSYDK